MELKILFLKQLPVCSQSQWLCQLQGSVLMACKDADCILLMSFGQCQRKIQSQHYYFVILLLYLLNNSSVLLKRHRNIGSC